MSLIVTAPNGVVPDETAVTLLVDINHDGTFAASVAGVVQNGTAGFTLPTLPAGYYAMKAQLGDATGVAWTSNVETMTVQAQPNTSGVPAPAQAPASTNATPGPQITVTVSGPNGLVPDGTAVTLLVDFNGDGTFVASATGFVQNGIAVFTSTLLTCGAAYSVETQLTSADSVVWTSDVQTVNAAPSDVQPSVPTGSPSRTASFASIGQHAAFGAVAATLLFSNPPVDPGQDPNDPNFARIATPFLDSVRDRASAIGLEVDALSVIGGLAGKRSADATATVLPNPPPAPLVALQTELVRQLNRLQATNVANVRNYVGNLTVVNQHIGQLTTDEQNTDPKSNRTTWTDQQKGKSTTF